MNKKAPALTMYCDGVSRIRLTVAEKLYYYSSDERRSGLWESTPALCDWDVFNPPSLPLRVWYTVVVLVWYTLGTIPYRLGFLLGRLEVWAGNIAHEFQYGRNHGKNII